MPPDAKTDVDPIEHLAKALYFDSWRDRGFVVATTIYADASGNDHSEPLCLVGGWWNSVENWVQFGIEWKAFLMKHGIRYLHQTKSKNDPDNDRWKDDQGVRNKVLTDALEIIQKSGAISHVFFTPTEDFKVFVDDALKQLPPGLDKPGCFAWNGFRFVVSVEHWCSQRHLSMPEFVFETSNKEEQNELRDVLDKYGLPEPIFRKKMEEDPARTVVALQAADFVAYEVYKAWKDLMRDGYTERPYAQRFSRMETEWHWADKNKLLPLLPMSAAQRHLDAIVEESKKQFGSF